MNSDSPENNLSICPDCEFESPPHANYCGGCGRSIGGEEARKQATILFADVSKSTGFIDEDLEDGQSIIKSVLKLMEGVARRHGGKTSRLPAGDGIMVLFADEDHARHAASAALAIHEAVDRDPSMPQVHIGAHSADVIVTEMESDLDVNHIVSPASSRACRVGEEAESGTTCVTRETARLVEGFIEVRSLGFRKIEENKKPIEIFELLGQTNLTRFQAYTLRGLSPFVGRVVELDALLHILDQVRQGKSGFASIVGDAGIGKSRLFHVFRESIPADSAVILEASAVAYGRNPYAMLGALVRSWLRVSPTDSVEDIRSSLNKGLEALNISSEYRSVLASVLDVPFDDPNLLELDPAQYQYRTFGALRTIMTRLCARGPLIVLCEDLHWLEEDSVSLTFFDNLLADCPAPGILLVLTQRPEFDHSWPKSSELISLHLGALNPDNRETLISSLVGDSPALDELRAKLADSTDGNPFFIEETIRSLVDDSLLVGRVGAYELGVANPKIELTQGVKSVIQARLDRLSRAHKKLLEAASLIGEEISGDELCAVLDLDQKAFRPMLSDMFAIGMLRSIGPEPSSTFSFIHSTVREFVSQRLLKKDKQEWHTRILGIIEKLHADWPEEQAGRLAHHSFEAGLWEQTVKYHQDACMRAAARSANGAAKRAIDKGLDALERILERSPDSEQWIREGIDLRLMGLAVLLPLGEKARTVELLREAKEMAESIGDEARLGRVTSQLGTSLWLSGEHAEALEAGESALKLARSHGRHRLEKSALHNIASVHYARADFDKAIDILGDLTEEFTGDLARQRFGWPSYPSVVFRTFLGASLTLVGDFQRAMTVFEEGLSIANEVEHPYSQTLILEEFGYCLHWMGRRDDALQSLTACMRICDDYDVYTMGSVTAGRLAFVLSENGQPEKGVEYAEAALKNDAHLRAGQIGYHILLFGLATAYLHTKRLTEALDTARLSAKLASDSNERACNAFAHALIGDIELARDAVTEAANEYTIALTIAQKQGMRPLEALCRQKLAEVYHRSSREIEAIQELQIALQTFEALGLPEHRLAAKNALRTLQQESRVAR